MAHRIAPKDRLANPYKRIGKTASNARAGQSIIPAASRRDYDRYAGWL